MLIRFDISPREDANRSHELADAIRKRMDAVVRWLKKKRGLKEYAIAEEEGDDHPHFHGYYILETEVKLSNDRRDLYRLITKELPEDLIEFVNEGDYIARQAGKPGLLLVKHIKCTPEAAKGYVLKDNNVIYTTLGQEQIQKLQDAYKAYKEAKPVKTDKDKDNGSFRTVNEAFNNFVAFMKQIETPQICPSYGRNATDMFSTSHFYQWFEGCAGRISHTTFQRLKAEDMCYHAFHVLNHDDPDLKTRAIKIRDQNQYF